jgi:hypothetical protein
MWYVPSHLIQPTACSLLTLGKASLPAGVPFLLSGIPPSCSYHCVVDRGESMHPTQIPTALGELGWAASSDSSQC